MSEQDPLALLRNERLEETLQVKLSAMNVIEYEAACAVMGYKPATHARNLMLEFVRKMKVEAPTDFSIRLEESKKEFLERKEAIRERNQVTILKTKKR